MCVNKVMNNDYTSIALIYNVKLNTCFMYIIIIFYIFNVNEYVPHTSCAKKYFSLNKLHNKNSTTLINSQQETIPCKNALIFKS